MVTRGAVLLVLALGRIARADSPEPAGTRLAEVRRAVRDVRYGEARRLLAEALAAGGSRPDELTELYLLSAQTATVLGQAELAEQYYCRVLELDPDAAPPADVSPRLRAPFVAARSTMAARGRLDAHITRRGKVLEVAVTADPLQMVAAVAAIVDGAVQSRIAASGPIVALDASDAVQQVALLDEHGNTLRALAAPPAEAAPRRVVRGEPEAPGPRTPILRRWITWTIPAAALATTGLVFALAGQRSKDRLDAIILDSSSHFLDEAERERQDWKTDTLISNFALAAAGALAVMAIVTAVTPASAGSHVAVVAGVGRHQQSIALDIKF